MEATDSLTVERVRPPHGVEPAMYALMLGTFAIGTGEFGMMGLLPEFAQSLGISIAKASTVISAYAMGVVIGAPIMAILGARLARRTLLMWLLVLFVLGNVGTILAPDLLTTEIMRFITGLPHGAFFGVSALVGASMVERARRGRAVSRVMSGIMFSTVLGSPLSTYAANHLGWRFAYGTIALLGAVCLASLWFFAPRDKPTAGGSALSELGAFRRPQVLLTLLTSAIGFGGLFGIYTFLTTGLAQVTHLPVWAVATYQVVWGLGMMAGNSVGGAIADRSVDRAVILSLGLSVVVMLGYWLFLPSALAMLPLVFLVPAVLIGLSPALQTRLMEVAGDAQTLAASLNHSAFNIANAIGAWLGAMLVGLEFGLGSVGWGGALLSAGGLIIYLITIWLARKEASV
ncbi:arabinose transmembrane efflux protein [Neokomagataea thailandica NBRC 106555]|uniref:MFS transporter n=2 Tax=Neokomagataea TaxID=1223423 RepID=A0A4Y6V814_9PROT|nr:MULTISPECIES: MFS transporter [Neokomagataea]QDH25018.1 MFS transporter [Neokomagataea tanensis]GBR51486.1 arabinose transmembrane efflux protein [Neokomagataea thailandica NBRC 106555]